MLGDTIRQVYTFRMTTLRLSALLLALVPAAANAGMPIAEEVSCHAGGETTEVFRTASCSYFGYHMDLSPVTSCDFVTLVGDCEQSGVALWRDFSEEEAARLGGLVNSNAFDEVRDASRFVRAHWLGEALGDSGGEAAWMLVRGAQKEPEVMGDRRFWSALEDEIAELETGGFDPEAPFDRVWVPAQVAALHAYRGAPLEAAEWLDRMEDLLPRELSDVATALADDALDDGILKGLKRLDGSGERLEGWADRLRACLPEMDGESCAAKSPMVPDE